MNSSFGFYLTRSTFGLTSWTNWAQSFVSESVHFAWFKIQTKNINKIIHQEANKQKTSEMTILGQQCLMIKA